MEVPFLVLEHEPLEIEQLEVRKIQKIRGFARCGFHFNDTIEAFTSTPIIV